MRYIDFQSGKGPEGLRIAQREELAVPSDKVKVDVKAFGVNRADTLQRQGKYPAPPGESEILGLEIAGEVSVVGDNVTQWKAGDRVCGLVAGGGYAQEAVVNPHHLIKIPDSMPTEHAAGMAEVFLTAYQSLCQIADIQKGQRALIHAGASGVGLAALQLCRFLGVETATTASSSKKLAVCQEMGAALTINYREEDFAKVLTREWPEGVNMVLDFVGGDYLNRNLKVLCPDGVVVYLAMLAGRYADKLDMALMLGKRARVQGSTLRSRSDDYKSALIESFVKDCLPGFDEGHLKVNIDAVLPADEIQQAHTRIEKNETQGKIVVKW
ncbi:NAD(P)H-quinone oxidoreductase [Alteromonas pelagimontana]|uniref:NAD(P)H-quinone oxidoreductase n=1 Tax=Alteromonas pelagimontana TaxID=1858656 RepID=A0A6M4M8F3_9ALTE|nr:NAD(P)H-quinone oxidoreductase [Alteromonas pelagimontana]QJR79472.1 NAD(P)H-quinone oxidoreductase [Alteromonas pelagimontana]